MELRPLGLLVHRVALQAHDAMQFVLLLRLLLLFVIDDCRSLLRRRRDMPVVVEHDRVVHAGLVRLRLDALSLICEHTLQRLVHALNVFVTVVDLVCEEADLLLVLVGVLRVEHDLDAVGVLLQEDTSLLELRRRHILAPAQVVEHGLLRVEDLPPVGGVLPQQISELLDLL